MASKLKHAAHLLPLVLVFFAGLGAFLIIRAALVPKNFGQYGHYRPAALDDIRQRPASFAGQAACPACHDDVNTARAAGSHKGVSCEACHGPLAKHADDPSALTPTHLGGKLCQRCHEADPAKPVKFPQVVTAEHSGGADCTSCHNPHSPKL